MTGIAPSLLLIATAAAGAAVGAALSRRRVGTAGPSAHPAGEPASLRTTVLKAGAAALQTRPPFKGFDIYLVGFHPMKDDPEKQFEAHHWCRQVNEDFAECILFDGNTSDANLVGIEYIISERLFDTLPAAERAYWHPHNGEILSGQLIAPDLPEVAEHALMSDKMNSYGKTWHLWDTASDDDLAKSLPIGEPMLAWSFVRDGEAKAWLAEQRDRRMRLDTDAKRRARQDLVAKAHPQAGVDALKGRYPRPTTDIPGVRDRGAG